MVDIIDALISLPLQIIALLWYIVSTALDTAIYILNGFYIPIATIANAFISLGNTVISVFTNILPNLFPASISTLLIIGISVVVAFRIWSFVSKISIVGCKVG